MADDFGRTIDEYKLKGLPLTPATIKELVVELFAGKTVERHEIVAAVEKAHFERGGAASRAAFFSGSVKKALSELKESGTADNPAYGFWRIATGEDRPARTEISEPVTVELEAAPVAELTLGEGRSSVYVYYYQVYRREAQSNARTSWPCKIGRSDRDPVSRIISQAGTAMPEVPEIGLVLKTDLPSQWEHVLHCVLALRGKLVEDAPGAEWFSTSPSEVFEIICYVDPRIKLADSGAAPVPAA